MNNAGRYNEEQSCRVCEGDRLQTLLDLGRQPLANALVPVDKGHQPVATYPLTLLRCRDCGLVQIRETIPPEVLFSDYLYFSSFADTLVSSARELATRIIREHELGVTDLVVELGSNDGYLLQFYRDVGIPVLGVEPAPNVAKTAREKRGIRTLVNYFDVDVAKQSRQDYGPAAVIHANNVLAHVARVHSFVDGMRVLLSPSGFIVIEVAYVKDMVDAASFDLIYHEHLCYFSLHSLDRLFRIHQLEIFDVEHISAHGGSLRVYVGHPGCHRKTQALHDFRLTEEIVGIRNAPFYEGFADHVVELRGRLCNLLEQVKREGGKIVAYGAAAKATVLFNYFGLGRETLEYVVDRNPQKQNRILPGPNLPIYPVERIEADRPDVILVTAWNYADEIVEQLSDHRARGGKFVIPLPTLKVVG